MTTDTPYLYMLRETGGIATGAYVDGRNKSFGTNKYYNSNIGVEALLLANFFAKVSSVLAGA